MPVSSRRIIAHQRSASTSSLASPARTERWPAPTEHRARLPSARHDFSRIPVLAPNHAAVMVRRGAVSGIDSRPLPDPLRGELEAALATPLDRVRLHVSGTQAAALGGEAFTLGRDIHFAAGRYAPETSQGRRL